MDWSIFTTVVIHDRVHILCCKRFWLCRDNLGGDEMVVYDDNASVLVCWRKGTPSSITISTK